MMGPIKKTNGYQNKKQGDHRLDKECKILNYKKIKTHKIMIQKKNIKQYLEEYLGRRRSETHVHRQKKWQ